MKQNVQRKTSFIKETLFANLSLLTDLFFTYKKQVSQMSTFVFFTNKRQSSNCII